MDAAMALPELRGMMMEMHKVCSKADEIAAKMDDLIVAGGKFPQQLCEAAVQQFGAESCREVGAFLVIRASDGSTAQVVA